MIEAPEGTAKDVTDWIGDDVERARVALAAENERDKPRKTVVGAANRALTADAPSGTVNFTATDGRVRTFQPDDPLIERFDALPRWRRVEG